MPLPASGGALLRRGLRRRLPLVLPGILLMTIWQLCEALVPIVIGLVVDRAIVPRDRTALLVSVVGILLLFTVLSFAYRFGARRLNTALHREAHALRVEVARHALLTRGSLDGRRPGAVLSLASADADVAAMLFRQLALGGSAVLGLVGASAYLLWADVPVGLVVILGVPLTLLAVSLPSRRISRRSAQQQEAVAEAGAAAEDTMAGLRVLAAIGGERWASRRYHAASADAARAGIRTADLSGRVTALGAAAVTVVLAAVVVVAGWRVTTGDLSVGQLVSIVGVAVFFTEPIQTVTGALTAFARSHGAAGRIAEFLAAGHPEPAPGPSPRDGSLSLRAALGDGDRRIELAVAPGALTVVDAEDPADAARIGRVLAGDEPTGSTGTAGTPDAELLVGGAPRATLPRPVRESLILAPHAADLFAGTLRSNIALDHDPRAAVDPRVLSASASDEVLAAVPHGLDQEVREGGSNLSGGQRQRIALARALQADPAVLVLEDPTSAVDSVTEWSIARGVREHRRGRTTVVLTASPAFHAVADAVARIPATGTPGQEVPR